ncbi:MAG: 23S rRNA (guanosine(2251)-2'-O)-methyltransferase RlmB [Clostridia bacterium]|nr:23S rRNA (guanosine(2251)-2'-O)-methyltransferase RlmB [Clostridia bacterium]
MPEGWIEGRNPVQEALRAGRTINKVWILKPKGKRLDPILSRLAAQAREAGAVVMEVERDALDRMAFSKGHQGVIAQAAAHSYSEWQDFVAAAREKGEEPLVLVLDELKDPYNLGSILRIADAAGVHGVVIPERNSVGLDALTAKASAGAIEHVPVARVVNVVATLEAMKKDGFWITGTAAEAETLYDAADYNGPTALVVGSEGEGLGRLVREHCDFLVGIPMLGKVNSLNVAVATGIVVFEAVRRRRIAKQGV